MAEKNETTLRDYLKWRGDLTFAADPFNEVDNLILCTIAYLNFSRFPQLRQKQPDQAIPMDELAAQMDKRDEQEWQRIKVRKCTQDFYRQPVRKWLKWVLNSLISYT